MASRWLVDHRRINVLLVGYWRRLFSVPVRAIADYNCLQDLVLERLSVQASFSLGLCALTAVWDGSFLPVDHADTIGLMQLDTVEPVGRLQQQYLIEKNMVIWDVIESLATIDHARPEQWEPRCDDVHLIIVFAQWNPNLLKDHQPYLWPLRPNLTMRDFYQVRYYKEGYKTIKPHPGRIMHSSPFELFYHVMEEWRIHWCLSDILHRAASRSSTCSFASLPKFNRLVPTQWCCTATRRPPWEPRRVESLQSLAELTVICGLLSDDPPAVVDPVHCVADVALYNGQSPVVLATVRCYIVFDSTMLDQHSLARGEAYVNPDMVAALDACSTLVDPTRPRLLVFVVEDRKHARIDTTCLPREFPSITVISKHLDWFFSV